MTKPINTIQLHSIFLHQEPELYPNDSNDEKITIPIITKTTAIKPQLKPLRFMGINNPPRIKITKITDNATPNLGNISEKNTETKSNCKAIKETESAIIAFIDLPDSFPSALLVVNKPVRTKSPNVKANNKRNGRA